MKKGLGIIGVLLLLGAAGLIYYTARTAQTPFIRVLGTTTNNYQRYVILNFTNTTSGVVAWNPLQRTVFTNDGKSIMTQLARPTNWPGFTAILKPATDCTFEVPIPDGAIRWTMDFNVTFQTPVTRVRDAVRKWQPQPSKSGMVVRGEFTSFGSPTRITTGDLPP